MELSGRVYILAGIFVTAYSFFVTMISGQAELMEFSLFIIIGIVFIVVGLFKWLIKEKKSHSKENKPAGHVLKQHLANQQKMQQAMHQKKGVPQRQAPNNFQQQGQNVNGPMHQHAKFCANCGSVSNFNDKFCRMCGNHQFYRK